MAQLASRDNSIRVVAWCKGLAIYIGIQSAEYLKDWGANINTEMEDGYATLLPYVANLWMWLMSQ